MNKKLAAVIVSIAFAVLGIVGKAYAADNPYPHLDPAKVAQVQHLSALLDKLPQKTYPLTLANSDQIVAEWEVEILGFYAHEGIASVVSPPAEIAFYFVPIGNANDVDSLTFHILGMSDCGTIAGFLPDDTPVMGPVWLNGRYINPVSPWYQDPSFLWTLVHELGHTQGICNGRSDYVESSAQIASAEILAAMANAGLDSSVLTLLDGWKEIVTGALEYDAIQAGALDEYDALLDATQPDAKSKARRAASRRYWNGHEKELGSILYRYELAPYVKIAWALKHPDAPCLAASKERGRLMAPHVLVPSGKALCLDDFSYFLAHADQRVDELSVREYNETTGAWGS